MSSIFDKVSLSNLWENYHNMPTKTTMLDRIIEAEKSDQQAYIQKAISEATNKDHIKSKQVDGGFFRRFDQAKAEQAQNTKENIQALNAFLGKGTRVDLYV